MAWKEPVEIAVVGGSGVYRMEAIEVLDTVDLDTPFGKPSAPIVIGRVSGKLCAFLPRHGTRHAISPSEIPARANVYALKSLGVKFAIGVNACGSLNEAMEPGHVCVPDDVIDFTRGVREKTFFDKGIVAHCGSEMPFCHELRKVCAAGVKAAGATAHDKGTFVCIEGPRFSTKAESLMFKNAYNAHIIGMTHCPEAFLFKEAEISYAVIAHITDFDVWHPDHDAVSVEQVIATFSKNVVMAQKAVVETIQRLDTSLVSKSHTALCGGGCIMTKDLGDDVKRRLGVIISNYFKE